jgi:hypothetical protein
MTKNCSKAYILAVHTYKANSIDKMHKLDF